MRLQATIDIFLTSEAVIRSPTLLERARRAFGAKLDLTTDRARVAIEATALVDQVRAAFKRMGIHNAVSLVIDDAVIFSDTDGKPDDMGDVMIALSEHAPVYGGGFRSVRFAAEHEEAGLHAILEAQCIAEHLRDEPAAKVRVGARVKELEAQPGESAEGYRVRVAQLVSDPMLLEGHRHQFEAFVQRLANALRAAFPEARVLEQAPEATVVRPAAQASEQAEQRRPDEPGYDPYAYYYPNPFGGILSGMLIGSFLSSSFASPHIMVVHPSGAPIAPAGELGDHTTELTADAPDPGFAGGDGHDGHGDLDGDFGDFGEVGGGGDLGFDDF